MSELSKLYKKLNEKNNPAIRLDKAIQDINKFGALQHGFKPVIKRKAKQWTI